MPSNREIVAGAFAAWMNGAGYVASIFADDMTWEITGRSAAAGKYASAREFEDQVPAPFGARFGADDPFRPIAIRAVYDDREQGTVVVVWDGRSTTTLRGRSGAHWVERWAARGGRPGGRLLGRSPLGSWRPAW
jgi:hypothetical protein